MIKMGRNLSHIEKESVILKTFHTLNLHIFSYRMQIIPSILKKYEWPFPSMVFILTRLR